MFHRRYAQAETEIAAARLLVYEAARRKMAGEPFIQEAAMAKLYASQAPQSNERNPAEMHHKPNQSK